MRASYTVLVNGAVWGVLPYIEALNLKHELLRGNPKWTVKLRKGTK